MTDAHDDMQGAADESTQSTAADAATDPAMVPLDDAAGGPAADNEQGDEPSAEEAAAQLGDFA